MKWIKKGHIFKPNGEFDWMNSHVMPARAILLKDKIRIFISVLSKVDLDKNYVSNATFIDVDINNPNDLKYINNKPIVEFGKSGMFDEFGVTVCSPVIFDNKVYLYYLGWQRLSKFSAPYQVMIGLAISDDFGENFTKFSDGPILGIDFLDPISIGNVSVLFENNSWKMWYTTYKRWEFNGQKPTPEYNIKYAESEDGIRWNKTGKIVIEENEFGGVATPTVIKKNGKYHMWFGYRKPYNTDGSVGGYLIGYASSIDGINWMRNDELSGIGVSKDGWDSRMICYPHVIENNGSIVMFYCGNGFGLTGFGYAELEGDLE